MTTYTPPASASTLFEVTDETLFQTQFQQASHCVLFFWADWHVPCKQLTPVIEQLSMDTNHKELTFFSIDAEKYQSISSLFKVTCIPTFIFCKLQTEKKRLEASTVPELVEEVNVFNRQALTFKDLSLAQNKTITVKLTAEQKQQLLNKRLKKLISMAPIMLFMKGSPENPQCKFSRELMSIFEQQKINKFGYFDILTDNNVRQGLKIYSNWKTYPQLYINNELIGGLDIIKELIEDNEFKEKFGSKYFQKISCENSISNDNENESEEQLFARIALLVKQQKVMLFMKGSPNEPRCGFSSQIVKIMDEQSVCEYGYFDILQDQIVRQGIKTFSNWPTFPQLYVNGKLIGGLDVIREMIEDHEFREIFE